MLGEGSGALGNGAARKTGFNASRCSSIYNDETNTVQPSALTARFYIKF